MNGRDHAERAPATKFNRRYFKLDSAPRSGSIFRVVPHSMRGRRARAANSCARARLLAGDNLSQEPMEQAGTIIVTSANEPVVVDSVEGSEDRARIIED